MSEPQSEIEIVEPQFEAELFGRRFQHAHALGDDLFADAVAGDHGNAVDAVGGHGRFPLGE
jgi:hypothetical protein